MKIISKIIFTYIFTSTVKDYKQNQRDTNNFECRKYFRFAPYFPNSTHYQDILYLKGFSISVKPTSIALSGVKDHVVQGTNVKLVCEVTGAKPAAEVKWFNESNAIPESLISTSPTAMVRMCCIVSCTTNQLPWSSLSRVSYKHVRLNNSRQL